MQTYIAEIDGRAIFAFRAVDDVNAQAWLDIHAVMRHTLETLHSGGRRIWNGQAQITARRASAKQATMWSKSSGEAAGSDPFEDADSVTVWLIPTTDERRISQAP